MDKTKVNKQLINVNLSRLKIISLISLGYSLFALITDYFVQGIWQDEHLYLYKILDLIFAVLSVFAIVFFWLLKIRNHSLQNAAIVIFPFIIIVWSAIISGIGFNTLNFSTLIVVALLVASSLYLNLTVAIFYFVSSGISLILTLFFIGDMENINISLIFILVPIIIISVFISTINFKNKNNDLNNKDEIVQMNKKLNYSNENLEKLVSERTNEIQTALEKVKKSDQLKTAFMNNISHEIRTPLNCILGFAPYVIEPGISQKEKETFLNMLNFSGERLMNTVNDYMDISLLVSKNMEMFPKPFNISMLMHEVVEHFQNQSQFKNLNLMLDLPSDSDQLVINKDKEIVRKILFHLVDNAIKFTTNGSVELGFTINNEENTQELELFVRDTGSGISSDAQKLVFEAFMQENVSSTRAHEGSGLGLSITKGLTELLGGKINLKSQPNRGTTVLITLPIDNSIPSEIKKIEFNKTGGEKFGNILIAEDDEPNFFFLETILKGHFNTLFKAKNGQEAVDLCRNHPEIELVLMDIKMPILNGIEATRQIKAFRKELPIFAITAFAMDGDEKKIRDADFNEYIPKPIEAAKLINLVSKYLTN